MSTPAKNPFSRVFLIEGRARPDHEPLFQSCMSAGPLTSPGGDVTSIECPSPDRYNEYVEVGEIQGEADRPSTDLQSLYQSDKEIKRGKQLDKRECGYSKRAAG